MREAILYGIIVLMGLVAVNGVGITTFLLGEHLYSRKAGPMATADTDTLLGLNPKNHLTDCFNKVE